MNILSKLSIACAFILCLASCKKKDDDNNNNTHTPAGPVCGMHSMVHHYNGCKDSTVILGSLFDKMSGFLKFSNCPGGVPGQLTITGKTFIYDGNKVYIVDTAAMADRDTLIVEAGSLRILEVRRSSSLAGGQIATSYEYAADGTLLRSISSFNSVPYDTALYTFSNGDMVMQVNTQMGHPDTIRYSYYTDKPVPANGYVIQNGLRYGSAFTYKNAHLLKGPIDGQGTLLIHYSYESGSYGNITRLVSTTTTGAPQSDTTTYHYVCIVE